MPGTHDLESTASLIALVRGGDLTARERLFGRYLPILTRWAHGRLPKHARDLSETADLIQLTMIGAMNNLGNFEVRHEGAFLGYLRTAMFNAVRGEIRRNSARLPTQSLDEVPFLADDSMLAQSIDRETLVDYEAALEKLEPVQREAVILRLEFGFSYEEIALAMDKPSANAARMFVSRALRSLTQFI